MSRNQNVVPSSAGYPVYSRLTTPVFAKNLVERYHMGALTTEITGNNMLPPEINRTGNEVVLRRAPEAEIRTYQKNQPLEHSDLKSDSIHMTIDRAKYWSLKLDEVDYTQIDQVNTWVNLFKEDAARKFDKEVSRELLLELPIKASPFNKGCRAGIKTGAYNLGKIGAPVSFRPDNMTQIFAMLEAVLTEQEVSGKEMFVILPYAAKQHIYHKDSPLYSVCVSGLAKSSVLGNSEKWEKLVGFNILFANDMPIYRDPITNEITYTILAGDKNATAFVTQLRKVRTVDNNHESFDRYWQGLQVYGFDVILPEALAVAYVKIDNLPSP